MKRLYTPLETQDTDYCENLGFPRRTTLHPGRSAHDVQGPSLDHATIRRICYS